MRRSAQWFGFSSHWCVSGPPLWISTYHSFSSSHTTWIMSDTFTAHTLLWLFPKPNCCQTTASPSLAVLWSEESIIPTEGWIYSLWPPLQGLCCVSGLKKTLGTKQTTEKQRLCPLQIHLTSALGTWKTASPLLPSLPPAPYQQDCHAASSTPTTLVNDCWQLQGRGVSDWCIIMVDRKM